MAEVSYSPENLQRLTLATWIYLLHRQQVEATDDQLNKLCEAIDTADGAASGDAAGWELVARVGQLLGDGVAAPEAVIDFGKKQFGDRLATDMGRGDRTDRTTRMRRYQFGRRLPWLARVYDRSAEGEVRPIWLVVEQVTDQVTAMDPNPWNDIDEERHLPVSDFHVLWELDGCRSLRVS